MTTIEQREKVYRMLASNPEIRRLAARALEVEEAGRISSPEYYMGWEWHQIPMAAAKLRVLVEEGVIGVSYSSRSSTAYLLEHPDEVREALVAIGDGDEVNDAIPPDLFTHIVGHDEVKFWLNKSLTAAQPVHILLVGPPATSKSLFLEGLGSLPGAQFALGGSSSKAGIADFLLNFHPRYLIIDELDKMKAEDYSVLLSLMQSGVVARLKKGLRDVQQMKTWVFAGVNRRGRLPPELLSRFVEFNFTIYTRAEFIEVAVSVITGQLGKDAGLARYIAEQVSKRTMDVRQAISLARLADTQEEVDRFEAGAAGRFN